MSTAETESHSNSDSEAEYLLEKGTKTMLSTRDGPKFGERRTSAEEFGRTFGSVRLGNV